jgi:hypothetical protein
MQTDSKGNKAWGAYGHCTEGGGAWAWRMQDYLGKYKIQSKLVPTATFNIVKTALKSGKLVILSTQLTSAGHIILVRGFTSTGSIIANDPYGNAKERGTYGSKINGEAVVYDWAFGMFQRHFKYTITGYLIQFCLALNSQVQVDA